MAARPNRSRNILDDTYVFEDFEEDFDEFEDISDTENSDIERQDEEEEEEEEEEEDDYIFHSDEDLRDYLASDAEDDDEDILDRIDILETRIKDLEEANTTPKTNEDFYFVDEKPKANESGPSVEKRLQNLERASKKKSKKKGRGKAREYLIDLIRNLRKELEGDPNDDDSVLREIKQFSRELHIMERENPESKHYRGRNSLTRAFDKLSSHSRLKGNFSLIENITEKPDLQGKKKRGSKHRDGVLGASRQKRRSSASSAGKRLSLGSAVSAYQIFEEKYPQDCYSFIALNGSRKNQPQTFKRSLFFFFGLLPFIFQMMLLIVLALSQTNEFHGTLGETDNPDPGKSGLMAFFANFTPANSTPIIRIAQVASLAMYAIFPGPCLRHIFRAVQLFPRHSWIDDSSTGVGYMKLSCILRLIQGVTAMVVTLFLVLTSTTVVEIVLNFIAVNFISRLDRDAFALAISGEFSPSLQDQAKEIAGTDLPDCMLKDRDSKWKCHKWVVGLVFLFLFGILASVFAYQDSNKYWVTGILRVQFQEETGLNQYSGCFGMNTDSNSMTSSRRTYHSLETGFLNTSFAYCREDRQWILFKGNTSDPCDTRLEEDGLLLARSSKTDTFDIATIFDESWVSASNTPLDLYFFDGQDEAEITEHCGLSLDDGICDPFFNELQYDFDGGDCCAATCAKADCGRGGLTSVFGADVSGDGFPNCVDPSFVPITIHLNAITSSRDPTITGWKNWTNADNETRPWADDEAQYDSWIGVNPVNPYFSLECNGRTVMTTYIDESMVNNSETAMVEDGASCILVIERPTSGFDLFMDDPIWFVDYTIFHDIVNGDGTQRVEILTGNSHDVEVTTFTRIPECYFRKLNNHTGTESVYTEFEESSSKNGIDWLLEDVECDFEVSFGGDAFSFSNTKIPSAMPTSNSSMIVL